MRLYNISTERSAKTVVAMSIIATIMTIGILILYFCTKIEDASIIGFIKWFLDAFNGARREMAEDQWVIWVLFLGFPVGIYGGLIGSIISRNNAIRRFNNTLNVLYAEFLPNIVHFHFNKPNCDIDCTCKDIDKVEMDIETKIVHTKNGSYTAFNQLILTFTIFQKNLKIHLTPSSPMKQIYQIIDLTRGVKKFSFHFSGYGEIPDLKEKTQTYLESEYKDMISDSATKHYMLLSVIFFGIGLFMILMMQNEIRTEIERSSMGILIFLPLLLFPIASFIIDIILVIDRIRDTQNKDFTQRFNIWHLIAIKITIITIIIHLCFPILLR